LFLLFFIYIVLVNELTEDTHLKRATNGRKLISMYKTMLLKARKYEESHFHQYSGRGGREQQFQNILKRLLSNKCAVMSYIKFFQLISRSLINDFLLRKQIDE